MYINIALLEKYCKKNGLEITTSVDIDSPDAILKFTRGSDKDGSRVEFLDFFELSEILKVNGVTGDGGVLQKESRQLKENDLAGFNSKIVMKIENAIYDTLAQYIAQLLLASRGKILNPHIIPLSKHRDIYFSP